MVPWPFIVGMRNFLVHEYFNALTMQVWGATKIDLPILIVELRKILDENPQ